MPVKPEDLVGSRPSTHFTWYEAACNCCGTLPDNLEYIRRQASLMEEVREYLGGKPITPNSWYRCPAHNKRVGGASASKHLLGAATDFTVAHLSPRQVQKLLKAESAPNIGGLGSYPGFTHVDCRSIKARWTLATKGKDNS